ncbi:unnamed protein product [Gongylonema pulchrum]|uniref:Secreted protein n=1 Tax=Gongylonema pulchrum TaxID=637853 RepID=A0A183DTL3_9BILA|nr:unnamed protein product [Gongylonema pulchrum]
MCLNWRWDGSTSLGTAFLGKGRGGNKRRQRGRAEPSLYILPGWKEPCSANEGWILMLLPLLGVGGAGMLTRRDATQRSVRQHSEKRQVSVC